MLVSSTAKTIFFRCLTTSSVGLQVATPTARAAAPCFCVIGSGPAGFYTAQGLFKAFPDAFVDIYEKLPTPFGLLRYGVAPDHPDVKNAINSFVSLAQRPRCTFNGNVQVGRDVTVEQFQDAYHAVILCTGADDDRKLKIPGENLRNVFSARSFVGWYNGLPDHAKMAVDLDVETVAVLGHGNVALDVARILLSKPDVLRKTDITETALEILSRSRVRRVVLLGRRGPLQVAFTTKELREMFALDGCRGIVKEVDFAGINAKVVEGLQRPRRRLTELMLEQATHCWNPRPDTGAAATDKEGLKSWELRFLRSPREFLPSPAGSVDGIVLGLNDLQEVNGKMQACDTGRRETLQCGLALTSIGYQSQPIQSTIPFNEAKGFVRNTDGRVSERPGLYCSGWAATGPVGVILSTMNDSFRLSRQIAEDFRKGLLDAGDQKRGGREVVEDILKSKHIQVVSFEDWLKIDKEEQDRGEKLGKPREKITDIEEMLRIARKQRTQ